LGAGTIVYRVDRERGSDTRQGGEVVGYRKTCKLEGRPKQLARISGYLMAALWLFVIVTGLAGSNLSPIWLVFLSPLFVVFLMVLIARSRHAAA
jgi:hypothetical protein